MLSVFVGNLQAGCKNCIERLPDMRNEFLAFRRQNDRVTLPVEDFELQLLFESFDALADGGAGDQVFLCSTGETT